MADMGIGEILAMTAIAGAGSIGGGLLSNALSPKPPALPELPAAPTMADATKQAALDNPPPPSPSDITNTGGQRGILTDANATYQKKSALGA